MPIAEPDRFWVKRYEPRTDRHLVGGWNSAGGGYWTLVRTAGDVVARITPPEGFIPLNARGDRRVGIIRDALGIERVASIGTEDDVSPLPGPER